MSEQEKVTLCDFCGSMIPATTEKVRVYRGKDSDQKSIYIDVIVRAKRGNEKQDVCSDCTQDFLEEAAFKVKAGRFKGE